MYVCQKCGERFEDIFLPRRTPQDERRMWLHKERCGGQLVKEAEELPPDSDLIDAALFSDLVHGESPIIRQWMKRAAHA